MVRTVVSDSLSEEASGRPQLIERLISEEAFGDLVMFPTVMSDSLSEEACGRPLLIERLIIEEAFGRPHSGSQRDERLLE